MMGYGSSLRTGLAALAVSLVAHTAPALADEPVKVGFVYVSPIGDAGWTYQHDLGRLEMMKNLGDKVTTTYVESVPEGADAERVIREMAISGHDIIFATSFGYMNFVDRVAKQFPNVQFMHATGFKEGPNFRNYNARFYEGRYLNGMIAGEMTKSDILGYVAAFPIPEVLQGINAFTLGAQATNPDVQVRVVWTNSWYDPGKEREAAQALVAQGADVITHHTDSTAVMQAAQDSGVYAMSYHSDMSKYGKDAQLSGTTHHWGPYYTDIVERRLAKEGMSESVWGGFKEGFVGLAPISPLVPQAVQDKVATVMEKMRHDEFHPFTGPLFDQEGKQLIEPGQVMTDAQLAKMNFYVKGVASKLPR